MRQRVGIHGMVVDKVLVEFVRRREPQLALRALAHAATITLLVVVLAPSIAGAAGPDPLRDQQWHLDTVHAEDAWQAGRGEGVLVAVIDTGVDATHPDLAGQVERGIDFVDEGTPPDDPHGHGTLVAGIVAALAANAEGGTGAAPGARILPIRVLDANGAGDSAGVARGIRWAADNGAKVINLSLAEVPGLLTDVTGLMRSDFDEAVRYADQRGALVVAAAGNDGRSTTPYPADLPLLIVGATDRNDQVWARSNRDSRTVFAPGVEIVSTWKDRGYGRSDGTSFAAPIVAAAAAILRGEGMTAAQARARIESTASSIGTGRGRVDFAAATGAPPRPRDSATTPAPATPSRTSEPVVRTVPTTPPPATTAPPPPARATPPPQAIAGDPSAPPPPVEAVPETTLTEPPAETPADIPVVTGEESPPTPPTRAWLIALVVGLLGLAFVRSRRS